MFGNEALEFIDDLDRCATAAATIDAMCQALQDLGIDHFCFNVFPNSRQRFDEVLLVSRVPAGWLELYIQENYVAHDPSQRHARRTVNPYEWKDAPYDPDREPKAHEFLLRANDFNIRNGLVVPIPTPCGCVGQVFMGGKSFRLTKRDKPALHLMAVYAFKHIEQLAGCRTPKPILTTREREILTWTATGKTAWEIGELLHLSARTVEWHLQSAAQKLGTLNKVQTLTVALREKLIAL